MLKKISVHNSRVSTAAQSKIADVTLVSDDNTATNVTSDKAQQETAAVPCNNCEDDCGGFLVDPVPAALPDQISDDEGEDQEPDHCNCNGRMGPCPLDGECRREKSCIYSCKVTRLDTGESETYTGLAGDTFKSRFYGHNGNINNKDQNGTKLSKHIWELKDHNIPHQMEYTCKGKNLQPSHKEV